MSIEEEARLKEVEAFNLSVKLHEARERVCEAAVEWWKLWEAHDVEGAWKAEDELTEASRQLAELEEQ